MKNKYRHLFIVFSMMLFSSLGLAQVFLNGNFEINTAAACDYNMPNASFTAKMANAVAYGGGVELDIMQSTCPYGPSQNGTWFVGLAAPSGITDAFTMGLSVPLVTGTTYTMSFYDKGDVTYSPGMPVIIGVSTVAGAAGTTVYTGPVPTTGVWSKRCFTFVAPNNGQYISVSTAGPTRWTHVDNFVMGGSCVLPIELKGFTAQCNENKINLNWTTTSENNNNYFSIERTNDGINYSLVGTINGAGNSDQPIDYSFVDTDPLPGTSYYQLKQTDFNGLSETFDPVSVTNCNAAVNQITLYPNLVSGNEKLHFQIDLKSDDRIFFMVYDAFGQLVISTQSDFNKGSSAFGMDISHLSSGIYFIKAYADNGEKSLLNSKFIKE